MAKMTDDDLKVILGQEVRNAVGYLGGKLANDRQTAMEYYLAQPFGDEQEGLSQIVIPVVRDVVETAMPQLMEMVAASDDNVEFEPHGPEDEQSAKQATDYVQHIIYKDNPGYRILYDFMKDGLLQKVGAVKVYTEDFERKSVATLTGLSEPELVLLMQGDEDNKIEALEHTQRPDGTHDIRVRRTSTEKRVRVVNIPPEELLVSRYARDASDPKLIGHRTFKTRSELIEMGYDRKTIESLPSSDNSRLYYFQEEMARHDKDENYPQSGSRDETTKEIEIFDGYIRVDFDGDGIAERRHVLVAGLGSREGGLELLENEECDRHKIAAWSPVRIPHVFHGLSLADLVMDLQLIKSTVSRQLLDNMYGMNSGRLEVAESHSTDTTLDDVLNKRPDGVIRTKTPGGIQLLQNVPIINEAVATLEYMDSVQENRTGVTKYNQGTDSDTLNKTASGINMIMTASAKRMVLIARMFAETGLREMFKMILHEIVTNQDKPRMVRLRDQWVPIDPRYWNSDMDVTVNVGLGHGTKEAQTQAIMNILGVQEKIIAQQGGVGGLVTPDNIYNAVKRLPEGAGFKHPELFFSDPKSSEPPQPKQDPQMAKVQADTQAKQAQMQADMQMKQQQMQMDAQAEQQKMQADIAAEQAKAQIEARLKAQEQQQEAFFRQLEMKQQAALDQQKALLDAHVKVLVAEISAKAVASREQEAAAKSVN